MMLTLLLIGMLTLAFRTQPTEAEPRLIDRAEGNLVVSAFHDRQRIHRTSVLDDSITNVWLDGVHQRSYYIRPQAGADVYNATIVMETPYSEEHFPWISWDPPANYTVTPLDGNFSYEWAYHDSISPFGQAAVWLETVFPVTFKPEFDFQRTIDPVHITSRSVNQTVKLEFTPHMDFCNTHTQVILQNTSEAIATVVPGSASPDWFWFETPSEVNWQFNPNMTTYTFSVKISVQNKLYPKPIFYKPSVWIGAFFDKSISVVPSKESVTVEDDLIKGSVTYSGKNLTGELYGWEVITQNENSVQFPSYSSTAKETTVFFNINPNPATVGENVSLKGILIDEFSQPLPNETVRVYARPITGSWTYITSLATNGYGIFMWQATIPAHATGTFIFAVYYPGSEMYESTYNLAVLIVQSRSEH